MEFLCGQEGLSQGSILVASQLLRLGLDSVCACWDGLAMSAKDMGLGAPVTLFLGSQQG